MDLWAVLVQDFHPLDPAAPEQAVEAPPPTLADRLVEQRERRNRMGGKPLSLDWREDQSG